MSCDFNPRAPCGARRKNHSMRVRADLFQPTRSVRSATVAVSARARASTSFQPTRSVRSATNYSRSEQHGKRISTHALRAERDYSHGQPYTPPKNFNPRAPCGARLTPPAGTGWVRVFQPTRSVRSATSCRRSTSKPTLISTHALRAERDHADQQRRRGQ